MSKLKDICTDCALLDTENCAFDLYGVTCKSHVTFSELNDEWNIIEYTLDIEEPEVKTA